jgi:hypothetical protein
MTATRTPPPTPPPTPPTLDAWLALDQGARRAALEQAPDIDACLLGYGDACEALAQRSVAAAIDAANTVLDAAVALGRARPQSRILRALVTSLAYAGRPAEAIDAAERAVAAARDADRPIDAARAVVALMHPLALLGRIDEALVRGDAARQELLRLGQPKLAARADINLANLRKASGDAEGARRHLERARIALADEPVMVAHLDNALGEARWLCDDLDGSRTAFLAALEHFRGAGDRFATAMVEGNLADLAAREGRLQDALARFAAARAALERDEAPAQKARIEAEEAEVLAALGVPSEAELVLAASIERLDQGGAVLEAARARIARATARARLARYDDAAGDVAAAIEVAEAKAVRPLAIRARLLASEIALKRGAAADAKSLAETASNDDRATPIDRAIAWHHRARALLALGEPAAALADPHADLAVETCRTNGLSPLLSDVLLARADARVAAGVDRGAALADYEESVAAIERVRSSLRAESLRASWLGTRTGAYEALATARLAEGTTEALEAAFDAVERSKSRSLLDLVQNALDRAIDAPSAPSTSRTDDAVEARAELDALRRRLNALYSRWEGDRGAGERLGASPQPALAALIRSEEAALQRLAVRVAALDGERSMLALPPKAEDIRRRLPAGVALVEYFIAGDELVAFVVKKNSITVRRRLATLGELRDLSSRILFQMRRATRLGALGALGGPTADARGERGLADALGVLRRGFDLLLRPLVPAIGDADTLVVVPHGPLHALPFHALFDGERWAIARWTIAAAPSAAIAVSEARSLRPDEGDVLLLGVPDDAAPSIGDEVDRIAAMRPDAVVLRDGRATADAFLRTAPRCALLHCACHGRFADGLPAASGLRLADRWVSMRELLDARLAARLVVLAGCDTGRAAIEPGDEAIGLARACMAAGAAAVLVSQWPVHDAAAGAFMVRFHAELLSGGGEERGFPAVSLASALRTTMLSTMVERPHPAFWGAFTLVASGWRAGGRSDDVDGARIAHERVSTSP